MSRFDQVIRPFVTHEAGVLSGTLNDSMAVALGNALSDLRRYPLDRFPFLLPMALRSAMRMELEKRTLPDGWEITGNSKLMGQLMLSHNEMATDLRFLKERRGSRGTRLPHAGSSPSRRKAWSGDIALPMELPSSDEPRTTILWVWDRVTSHDSEIPGFAQRLVHTLAPGSFFRAVPCDLSIDLLPGGGIFDHLKFEGGDDDTDLFAVQIDEATGNEG